MAESETNSRKSFNELFVAEQQFIRAARAASGSVDGHGNLDAASSDEAPHDRLNEPMAQPHSDEFVGLALSGGGIRSATFNLGLLQGLNRLGLLHLFDYLSTVSGGGYIGGWWTAWKRRGDDGKPPDSIFPESSPRDHEPEPIRHLRRFSNFLTPRLGLLTSDMWNGIVSIISGMIPTLLLAMSILTLLVWGFVGVVVVTLQHVSLAEWAAVVVFLVTLVFAGWRVRVWIPLLRESKCRSHHVGGPSVMRRFVGMLVVTGWLGVGACALIPVIVPEVTWLPSGVATALLVWLLLDSNEWFWMKNHAGDIDDQSKGRATFHGFTLAAAVLAMAGTSGYLCLHPGVVPGSRTPQDFANWILSPRNNTLLAPGLVLFATAFALLVLRYISSWSDVSQIPVDRPRCGGPNVEAKPDTRQSDGQRIGPYRSRQRVAASSRAIGRLLRFGIAWMLLAALWESASRLRELQATEIAFAGSGGLFAIGGEAFRRLLNSTGKESTKAETGGLVTLMRRWSLRLIAYVLVGILIILCCLFVQWSLTHLADGTGLFWVAIVTPVGLVALIVCLANPEALGLHSFYRGRIARTYLGASNPEHTLDPPPFAARNSQTVEKNTDDIPLQMEISEFRRPFHLVCCAANNLAGDHVADFGRGARSAVLSCLGTSLGNWWGRNTSVTTASAQTASAAAFNSQMGTQSMRLGPAVGFLATALNLRLGLWVRHPADKSIRPGTSWFRGALLLREMFSRTYTELDRSLLGDHLHLSDGAHFENLGLYELVRRRCRYIIVSDCGADPELVFDDLGNALRRIREDFGVEIELDTGPLKPGPDGNARQHMAVGTINYGLPGDQGTLLYFKPALTADEPRDIEQYKARNAAFPNETTVDQFYDEAQWESYRRLGEHSAQSALRFVEDRRIQKDGSREITAHALFTQTVQEWYPTPEELRTAFLNQGGQFLDIQDKLRTSGCPKLIAECTLPNELAVDLGVSTDEPDDSLLLLPLLMEMAQVMENTFLACRLDRFATHPLNLGWMNLFQQWSHSNSFTAWWPLIQPLFGAPFRKFVNEHLGLAKRNPGASIERFSCDTIRMHTSFIPAGFAVRHYFSETPEDRKMQRRGLSLRPMELGFTFNFPIGGCSDDGSELQTQLALLVCNIQTDSENELKGIALWSASDLFVPSGLWGTGIGSALLRGVLQQMKSPIDVASRGGGRDKVTLDVVKCRVALPRSDLDSRTIGEVPAIEAHSEELSHSDVASRAAFDGMIRFYSDAGFRWAHDDVDNRCELLYTRQT